MSVKHTVICTAGHIDHGKSALIERITGSHPDVLQEERDREMTIELGFAFYGEYVTFIDVPGHEKFLKTMLAGASGVDGAILVIAADDGVMPQTREHFEILQLMGVERGLIALTKIDIVEEEWIELVKDDIEDLVKGTFLENAPITPLSNKTGEGFDDFQKTLNDLIISTTIRKDRGLFRMWLDRSFTIKGSGTVVAGTVLSGSVGNGDKVEILPTGKVARIKEIQVHKKVVKRCKIGERAALNIPGVDKNSVQRGDLLATPYHYRPTFMLNARLSHTSPAKKSLQNRLRIRLHLGSSEIIGRLILIEDKPIAAGETAFVQFRLESQVMADVGDRFVIRGFSEGRVLGGGVILETHPKKMRYAKSDDINRLQRLESAEPKEVIGQLLERTDQYILNADKLSQEVSLLKADIIDILNAMERDGEIQVVPPRAKWMVILKFRFDELCTKVLHHIEEFHKKNPSLQGVRRSDLKSALLKRAPLDVLEGVLSFLSERNDIVLTGEIVSLNGFEIRFSLEQTEIQNEIEEYFKKDLFNPPNPESMELSINWQKAEPVFTGIIQLGRIVRLFTPEGKAIYYHKDALEEAKRKLLEFFKRKEEMRFFEFRELIGSSRKFTTPILTYFDDQGVTIRDGEIRRLR